MKSEQCGPHVARFAAARYPSLMQYLIVSMSDERELDRVVLDGATPFEQVKARAGEMLLQPGADLVIVSNGGGDELWRCPEGYDA